ncbi:hypothetical protein GS676_21280 [Rhodococcus hoagii]|nr:hypothetical protein [Prescottella equi]
MSTTTNSTPAVPVILTGQALRSLRDSGYTLPAAIGEVIDNSLEARANAIDVRLDEEKNSKGKKHIHRIAFADDGDGMPADVLHHYPQIGYSTRYMSTDTIGKFGVGAKLAALNFGRRLDVWSRTAADEPWLHVSFDLDEAWAAEEEGKPITILPPDSEPVPDDLVDLLPTGPGTLVAWSKIERLEHGRRAADSNALRLDVEKELSRIFRVFINNGIIIRINGQSLLPHDPLMLMKGTWAEQVLTEYYTKGKGRDAAWKPDPLDYSAKEIHRAPIDIGGSRAWLTMTLYPPTVTRKSGMSRDALAKTLRLPENAGAISFMRLDREISYTNVPRMFPRGVQDPDRFIGIEVSFKPELDEYFGVRNVKRGAEPHDELRAAVRKILQDKIKEARRLLEEYWGVAAQKDAEHSREHDSITDAVADADRTMPKSRARSDEAEEEALKELANDALPDATEAEKQEYITKAKDLPFVVESVDFPGTQFIDILHVEGKVIIRLNTRHRFYKEAWGPLREIAKSEPGMYDEEVVNTARRAVEGLTLLVIAYGKAESMDESPFERYSELRNFWGMFLGSMMGTVKDVL